MGNEYHTDVGVPLCSRRAGQLIDAFAGELLLLADELRHSSSVRALGSFETWWQPARGRMWASGWGGFRSLPVLAGNDRDEGKGATQLLRRSLPELALE